MGVLPGLVVRAAIGLALTMAAAAVLHARRGEWAMIGANAVLFALAVFVAVQRSAPMV